MRRAALALVLLSVMPHGGHASWPLTQPACGDVGATVHVWRQLGGDVLENLGFDGLGNVWIANSSRNRIERWTPGGTTPDRTLAVPAPGAILRHGAELYVNFGDAIAGAMLRTGEAGVFRFEAASPPATTPAAWASGWDMSNGSASDGTHLYVSNDVGDEVVRIAFADGAATRHWSRVWGTNGLVSLGGSLYAAITFDQRSPIARIPLSSPHAPETFAELSFGALSLQPGVHVPGTSPAEAPLLGVKGLDDMTLGPDGRLYVVANGTGELLRLDLGTREACLIAGGFQNPSSVRFAEAFGDFTGKLFVTEFSGAVRRVTLNPV